MMSLILVGVVVRMYQGLVMATPTLMTGLFIAGVLRYYLGSADTRRLFGGDSFRSLPQSWLIGMLLPVCSIGVLPILIELHRARVRPGAMTAFALSAPLFNPLSLLYGLTLSRPIVIISFALASLVMVTLLGVIWDRFSFRRTDDAQPMGGTGRTTTDASSPAAASGRNLTADEPEEPKIIGLWRMLALIVYMARELTGRCGGYVLLALAGLGMLAVLLPYSALQSAFEMGDPWAPARMTLLAVPVYATPMTAMSQLGMMFLHSNSPGAALALLLLGAGMNLATLVWFVRRYGVRAISIWFVSLLAIVLASAYAIDRPLVLPGAEPAGHTHAFDLYATPFHPQTTLSWQIVSEAANRPFGLFDSIGLGLLAVIAVGGWLLRRFGIDEARFQTAAATQVASYDRVVPASVLGVTMLGGLIALSVVGCYAYYPSPQECLEEISTIRSEAYTAALSGNVEQAIHWIEQLEDWSRKLEVGTFLRVGEVRPYQRMQGRLIRKKLELLEHELEHDPFEQDAVNELVRQLFSSDQRWRDAFR